MRTRSWALAPSAPYRPRATARARSGQAPELRADGPQQRAQRGAVLPRAPRAATRRTRRPRRSRRPRAAPSPAATAASSSRSTTRRSARVMSRRAPPGARVPAARPARRRRRGRLPRPSARRPRRRARTAPPARGDEAVEEGGVLEVDRPDRVEDEAEDDVPGRPRRAPAKNVKSAVCSRAATRASARSSSACSSVRRSAARPAATESIQRRASISDRSVSRFTPPGSKSTWAITSSPLCGPPVGDPHRVPVPDVDQPQLLEPLDRLAHGRRVQPVLPRERPLRRQLLARRRSARTRSRRAGPGKARCYAVVRRNCSTDRNSIMMPVDLAKRHRTFGPTAWRRVTQDEIDAFARHQRRSAVDPHRRRAGRAGESVRHDDRPRQPDSLPHRRLPRRARRRRAGRHEARREPRLRPRPLPRAGPHRRGGQGDDGDRERRRARRRLGPDRPALHRRGPRRARGPPASPTPSSGSSATRT